MTYAIIQATLDPPPLEAMRAALAHARNLVPADAGQLVRDARGILAGRLTQEDAAAIQGGLAAQGIQTEIVDESLLPMLPAHQQVSRVDCPADRLVVYDALNRPADIAWADVALVAAGVLLVGRRCAMQNDIHFGPNEVSGRMMPSVKLTKPTPDEWTVEFIVEQAGSQARYRAVAGQTRTTYLSERMGNNSTENFMAMAGDLARLATSASLNSGAAGLAQTPPVAVKYPSRRTFEEEMVWLLWQSGKRGQEPFSASASRSRRIADEKGS